MGCAPRSRTGGGIIIIVIILGQKHDAGAHGKTAERDGKQDGHDGNGDPSSTGLTDEGAQAGNIQPEDRAEYDPADSDADQHVTEEKTNEARLFHQHDLARAGAGTNAARGHA
jgi:hypothetical protein